MRKRTGPDFIGIGAPHAGLSQVTTWLSEHPAVTDTIRTYNFFSGPDYEKRGASWYEAQLQNTITKKGQKSGDISASYLSAKEVPERIASLYPDAQLFAVLRHPLKRALAAYEAEKSIDAKVSTMTAATYLATNPALQIQSRYADSLEYYFGYYAPVNLHMLVYEEMVNAPLDTAVKLYDFLELDSRVIPKSLKQFAPPPEPPKNPGLIKRGVMKGKAAYKKLTERPPKPVFGADIDIDAYLSSTEKKLFTDSLRGSTEKLSHFMGRDMVAFWELD